MAPLAGNYEPQDDRYRREAIVLLKNTFTLTSVAAIQRIFRENEFSFAESYDTLHSIQAIVKDETVRGEKEKRKVIISISPFLERIAPIVLKARRKTQATTNTAQITSPQLLREIEGKYKAWSLEVQVRHPSHSHTQNAVAVLHLKEFKSSKERNRRKATSFQRTNLPKTKKNFP